MTIHDFGMPLTYSDEPPVDKKTLAAQLEADRKAFLSTGGAVTLRKPGETGLLLDEVAYSEMLSWPASQRIAYMRKRQMLNPCGVNAICHSEFVDEHVKRLQHLEAEQEVLQEVVGDVEE